MILLKEACFLATLFVLLVSNASTTTILKSSARLGSTCDLPLGLVGRCEINSTCRREGGSSEVDGKVTLCQSADEEVVACCRKPFEIAKALCRAWKTYWSDNEGNCVVKKPLVIGGEEASVGQFPEIGLLGIRQGRRYVYVCGGTLVSPHFVLTAAHCVKKKGSYVVRFGVHHKLFPDNSKTSRIIGVVPSGLFNSRDLAYEKRQSSPVEQMVKVKTVIPHPNYEGYYDDVALLQLEKPVVLTKRVLPACLPTASDAAESAVGAGLTVVGWGLVDYRRHTASHTPQFAQIPIIDSTHCAAELKKVDPFGIVIPRGIDSSQMCAGEKGRNACKGDSGGPLLNNNNDSTICEHSILGIVSFGKGCSTISVYGRVSSYVDWITRYIAPKVVE